MGADEPILIDVDPTKGLEWLKLLKSTHPLPLDVHVLFALFETHKELADGLTDFKVISSLALAHASPGGQVGLSLPFQFGNCTQQLVNQLCGLVACHVGFRLFMRIGSTSLAQTTTCRVAVAGVAHNSVRS